ncbi:MAG: APC family permease [Candidatus Thermoplasmatota archaeon]|nr:APC family permease [Candidatus Thermoplasmatota archaeon]
MSSYEEETHEPKKNIPKAILIAVVLSFVVYAFSSYALIVGWGINNMSSFATTSNPGFIVVEKYLGLIGMVIFILITLNSFISESIAQGNAFSRVGYAMARDRMIFPYSWSETHTKYGSPKKIIAFEMPVSLAVAIIAGILFGPFTAATILTTMNGISLYIVHIISNISLPVWGKLKLKTKITDLSLMIFIPLVASVIYIFAIYGSIIPFPGYPFDIGIYLIIPVIVSGIIIALITKNRESKIAD